jgi:hypothetical protein
MIDLRDRLQELADFAAAEGVTPGPGAAVRRGRRRRRHLAAGVASVLAVALVATAAVTGRLGDAPASPSLGGPRPTRPNPTRHLSTEEIAFEDLSAALRRCKGGGSAPVERIATVRSREWHQLWMVAAKPPPPGTSSFCRTTGLFSEGGGGGYGGAPRARPAATLTAEGTNAVKFATIEGEVTKRAALVRVRFRDGRPSLELAVIRTGARYPVNFYVGFFAGSGSEDEDHWPPAEVIALDARERAIAACTVGRPWDAPSSCPVG